MAYMECLGLANPVQNLVGRDSTMVFAAAVPFSIDREPR